MKFSGFNDFIKLNKAGDKVLCPMLKKKKKGPCLSPVFFFHEWRHVPSSKSGNMGVPLSKSNKNPVPL